MSIDQKFGGKRPERRRFERCQPEDASATYNVGFLYFLGRNRMESPIINLSKGGLCIRVGERIKPGTRAKMTITIPHCDEPIHVSGIVRSCFQSRADGNYYAGLEFTGLRPPLPAKLASMCEYLNSPQYKARCRDRSANRLELPQ